MESPFIFPRTCRVLAPGGGFISPNDILSARTAIWQMASNRSSHKGLLKGLSDSLRENLKVEEVSLFGSGKESLFELFSALAKQRQRKEVILSAYTCPDIATAAVEAGYRIYAADINPETLEIDQRLLDETLVKRAGCVVLSNLYGLVDSVDFWKNLFLHNELTIIDDACQAALSNRAGRRVGCFPETFGVLSFGRGKAFCGVGGGAVLMPPREKNKFQISLESSVLSGMPNVFSDAKSLTSAYLSWLFIHPLLYRIPASMRFLGLGETKHISKLSRTTMSAAQAIVALGIERKREFFCSTYLKHAERLHELLAGLSLVEPLIERGQMRDGDSLDKGTVPIRYPLVLPSEEIRDILYRELNKSGLGASVSYPCSLWQYPKLKDHLVGRGAPVADKVAKRILTLPLHSHVTEQDMVKTVQIIKRYV